MLFTLAGITTDVSLVSENALFPMASTASPSISEGIVSSVAVPVYFVMHALPVSVVV